MPIEIKTLNTLHPKQYPTTDSRNANRLRIDSSTTLRVPRSTNQRIKIDVEKTRPTLCANRLGAPGTNFSSKFDFGIINLVTIRARGLTFGPEETLAKNP
tara:strand:- start:798 stop:1097 length:300 start_codon:yes stop_codon:yes gene_type:complete